MYSLGEEMGKDLSCINVLVFCIMYLVGERKASKIHKIRCCEF